MICHSFTPMFLFCCFILSPVSIFSFHLFFYSLISLFVYALVASLCTLVLADCVFVFVCVCVLVCLRVLSYSASSRSSPCLDNDNSRWYSLYSLLSLFLLSPSDFFSFIHYQMTSFPFCLHDLRMHECTFLGVDLDPDLTYLIISSAMKIKISNITQSNVFFFII